MNKLELRLEKKSRSLFTWTFICCLFTVGKFIIVFYQGLSSSFLNCFSHPPIMRKRFLFSISYSGWFKISIKNVLVINFFLSFYNSALSENVVLFPPFFCFLDQSAAFLISVFSHMEKSQKYELLHYYFTCDLG